MARKQNTTARQASDTSASATNPAPAQTLGFLGSFSMPDDCKTLARERIANTSGTVYAYCRVSSAGQKLDRQIDAMLEVNVPRANIFADKQSGSSFDRPEFQKLMNKLRPGDTLVIKSLDRFGRNYTETPHMWHDIIVRKGVSIIVLDDPILNLIDPSNLILQLVVSMLFLIRNFFSELERRMIHERQAQGIRAAKERGVKFGRPAKPLPPNFEEAVARYSNHEMSVRQAAAFCGMAPSTFYAKARKRKTELAAMAAQA